MPARSDSVADSGTQAPPPASAARHQLFTAFLLLTRELNAEAEAAKAASGRWPAGAFDTLGSALRRLSNHDDAIALAGELQRHLRSKNVDLATRTNSVLNSVMTSRDIAQEQAKPWVPLSANALPPRRQQWLTSCMSSYAVYLVGLVACGDMAEAEARAELFAAAVGTARHEGWPDNMGERAADAAWSYGEQRFQKFRSALRGRIWPMGRDREPGGAIMMAAREVNDGHGWILPTPLLEDAARRIARAAAVPGRPRLPRRG